jgi:NAD(P)-dependent dehydrogenase (short-subunit alcohol dehydrogenase family)
MKVFLVGAAGDIGKVVAAELAQRHEIITGGRTTGDVAIDMTDLASIRAAFGKVGAVDAVVSTAGAVTFSPFKDMDDAAYRVGIDDKLMGQVNLVLIGRQFVAESASFTLTTGILNRDPIVAGSSASMVNGALEGFVKGAAYEMDGLRLNAISPGLLEESVPKFGAFFPGHVPVPGARVAKAYAKSVEGRHSGEVFEVF